MSLQTPLYAAHQAANGKLVDFAGWQLPIHYGSLIDEHHAVRQTAGMFDVSHMTVVDIDGTGANAWLRMLLTNDVNKIQEGQALYSCLCNASGGVIDDLIAYRRGANEFRVIVNAATREQDLAWLEKHKTTDVNISIPDSLAMIAIQGPQAIALSADVLHAQAGVSINPDHLSRFGSITQDEWFIGRTGYTGEDGLEVVMPAAAATDLWNGLLSAGIKPAGLGARDTLRLEAGMCLYGNDLDLAHSPVESGIAWAVDINDEHRTFIGHDVLRKQKLNGATHRQIGLVLTGRGVLRAGQIIRHADEDIGVVTSGTFSPSLQRSIAVARVSKEIKGSCDVIIRDKAVAATVVAVPFIKNGKATFVA